MDNSTALSNCIMAKFTYYNINPSKHVESDCVTRAIATASGLNYITVCNLLDLVSEHTGYHRLTLQSYSYLLEKILLYPVFWVNERKTVDDIIQEYPNNTLLIRIRGHLLCSVAGAITDLWDSSDEPVTCFWIAK